LVPFATQWPSVVASQYAAWVSHMHDSTGFMRERQRAIDCLFVLWQRPLSPLQYAGLEVVGGAVVLALAWFQRWLGAGQRELLTRVWLLFGAWAALLGPATESCTYVIMAPGMAWSLVEAQRRQAWKITQLWLIASLVLMGPLVTDLVGPTIRNFANEHGSQPVGALLFLGYLLVRTGQRYSKAAARAKTHLSAPLPTAA
jgi:hypothetical protein